jgi:asparagine synthase (glutamine-hydrolysing)
MCGIAGIVSRSGDVDLALLERMRDAMAHRGPDSCGLRISGDHLAGLAHRRLAIIDLSPAGAQPMTGADPATSITFNGEIYNFQEVRAALERRGHVFRSASDTEVILAAYREWGLDCLDRLAGAFAFALYDETRRRLFLARDRAGEKPLYYARQGDRLLFASELKGLMADPSIARRLDRTSFEFFLAYGYTPGDRSMLRGVHKLPQGHAATLDVTTGDWRVWPYWQLPAPATVPDAPIDDLAKELEGLLERSVRQQLIADVPVGILLSGGIDSSLVTAMAARVSSTPVRTFTVTFPGHRAHDEAPHARAVAAHFGTRHTELAGEAQSVDTMVTLARQFDDPIGDSAIVPTYLVSRLIRREATVALGGDGGDELFGGYPHYGRLMRQERVRRIVPRPPPTCR